MRHEAADYWSRVAFFSDKKILWALKMEMRGAPLGMPHINPYIFSDGGVIDSL